MAGSSATPRRHLILAVKNAGRFATVTAISQAAALVTGFLIVRALPKDSYAIYAIAIGAIAAASTLSDSGVNSTLLAAAGKVVRIPDKVRAELQLATRARNRLLALAVAPLLLVTAYLLLGNGGGSLEAIVIAIVIACSVVPDMNASLFRVILTVRGELRAVERALLVVALVRLVLVAGIGQMPGSWALPFLVINALGAWLQWWVLRTHVRDGLGRLPIRQSPHAGIDARYRSAMRHTVPHSLALVIAPQIVSLLLTWNGNTAAIAEVSALSRFAMAFVVINGVMGAIVSPAVARQSRRKGNFGKSEIAAIGIYGLTAFAFVGVSALFSTQLLWLIGSEYADLGSELIIVSAGCAVSNFAMYGLGSMNFARGWTRYSWVYVPLLAVWFIASLAVFDLTTPSGAMWCASTVSIVELLTQITRLIAGMAGSRARSQL